MKAAWWHTKNTEIPRPRPHHEARFYLSYIWLLPENASITATVSFTWFIWKQNCKNCDSRNPNWLLKTVFLCSCRYPASKAPSMATSSTMPFSDRDSESSHRPPLTSALPTLPAGKREFHLRASLFSPASPRVTSGPAGTM